MTAGRSPTKRGEVITMERTPSQAFDAPVLVWWPDEAEKLAELREAKRPRLVVVQAGAQPPISGDLLEDWVHSRDTATLPDRIQSLMARARPFILKPSLDESGVLHVGRAWTALSDAEVDVAHALVDAFGSIVTYDDMSVECGTGGMTQLRQRVARLRNRVRAVGLDIRVVRSRGYMLVRLPSAGAATPSFA